MQSKHFIDKYKYLIAAYEFGTFSVYKNYRSGNYACGICVIIIKFQETGRK